jgi:PST family polysaccharide transporter/lipopolysaccharide exporter
MLDEIGRQLKTAVSNLIPSGGLAERTVKSGLWLGGIDIGSQILQLIVLVILARLLDPGAFGLVGIATLTLHSLNEFSKLGFNEALIQRNDDNVDHYLDTAWSVQLVRSAVLAAIVIMAAPTVASFFREPRVINLLRVIAVAPLMNGLINPGVIYFQKNLEFHKQFAYQMGSSVAQFLVSIGIALIEPSVWALVLGYIAENFAKMVGSYLLHGYRPRPAFNPTAISELFDFGKWITVSSMISFLLANGDDFVVGRLLPTAMLGLYRYGYRLGEYSTHQFASIIGEVMFASYAKLQDDLNTLREAYFHALLFTTLLVFPMGVGAIVVAPLFVRGFLGSEWMPIVPVFQLVALWGLLSAATGRPDALWKAVGRPDYKTKLRSIWLILGAGLVIPMTEQFGIVGTAAAMVGAYLVTIVPAEIYITVTYLETTYSRYLGTVVYPFSASMSMGIIIISVRESIYFGSSIVELLLLVPLGAVIYGISILSFNYWFDWELRDTCSIIVNAIRG